MIKTVVPRHRILIGTPLHIRAHANPMAMASVRMLLHFTRSIKTILITLAIQPKNTILYNKLRHILNLSADTQHR